MDFQKNSKVFVMEDDKIKQQIIAKELKGCNVHFFSKDNSVFDLLRFNPDVLVQDYFKNKVVECYKWN